MEIQVPCLLVLVYGRSHSQLCASVGSLKAKSRFAKGKREGGEGKEGAEKLLIFPGLTATDFVLLCFPPGVTLFHRDASGINGNSHTSVREWHGQCGENSLFSVQRSLSRGLVTDETLDSR